MNQRHLLTEHPASVGESYLQHLCIAARFGVRMVAAGFACLVHAILPFMFVRTGSRCIERLHDDMLTRRRRKPFDAVEPAQPAWSASPGPSGRPAISRL